MSFALIEAASHAELQAVSAVRCGVRKCERLHSIQ